MSNSTSDFVKKLKRNTKASRAGPTVEFSDVSDVLQDNTEEWREIMLKRSQDGFNYINIWEFMEDERVYIINKNGEPSYDIDKNRIFPAGVTVVRSYSIGQFFNSETFSDWVSSIFFGCNVSIDYIGGETYTVKIMW